jgi:hypothetical protein
MQTGEVVPLLIVSILALALLAGLLAVRRSGPRMSTAYPLVVEESPLTVIDRVEHTVTRIRGYACERRDREIVIFRKHDGPLGFFEHPDAPLAEATMDLLHVTAERKDGTTEVWIRGRSEPHVINRVRRSLARARQAS